MPGAIMDIFQTYKAFVLKSAWERDLELIRCSRHKIIYKFCLPWRSFLGLSMELAILIMLFLLYVGVKEFSVWSLPLIFVISLFIALEPLAYILVPLALYNVFKIHYNKWRNKNNGEFMALKQKEEAIKTNLRTIQNGLTNHSVVPSKFQTEDDLQQMMESLKSGKAVDDTHAVYLYSNYKEIKVENKTKRSNNKTLETIWKSFVISNSISFLIRKKLIKK